MKRDRLLVELVARIRWFEQELIDCDIGSYREALTRELKCFKVRLEGEFLDEEIKVECERSKMRMN